MVNEIEEHLGNYLLMVTMINVGVGVVTGLICAVTGMPNPAGLGALAAVLNFIPIIGPVAMFAVLVVVGQGRVPQRWRRTAGTGAVRGHDVPGRPFPHPDDRRPPAGAERARRFHRARVLDLAVGPDGLRSCRRRS